MTAPDEALRSRIAESLGASVDPLVSAFARDLAHGSVARAVLFYGSNLRTGSLEGVLDYYLLLPGESEAAIWPTVSYHEQTVAAPEGEKTLRAKVATMTLATFAKAASGEFLDTTIWARFVQPSALIFVSGEGVRDEIEGAIEEACKTAARLAVALGPDRGEAADYWSALFRATYEAELRVEKRGRENEILAVNAEHFDGLLPLALEANGIDPRREADVLTPALSPPDRRRILTWWKRRQRMGKALNLLRLAKATTTFEGAARYAAWKVERHTGRPITVSPLSERFPPALAPQLIRALWARRSNP